MSIPIQINNELLKILELQGIEKQNYKPAYDGKSIGLDLYNAGPLLEIPSINEQHTNYFAEYHPITQKKIGIIPVTIEDRLKTLIPTGLRIALPDNWVAIIQERGSITKTSLKVRAGVIDPEYTGEIFVNCVNLSSTFYKIEKGEKLPFQLVVLQARNDYELVSPEEYDSITKESTRKEGMIGSSD